jgi:hypothetical protein
MLYAAAKSIDVNAILSSPKKVILAIQPLSKWNKWVHGPNYVSE